MSLGFEASYGYYQQFKPQSNIEPFKPTLPCIKLPSSSSKIVQYVLPLIAIIGISSLPFAGVPLHLFSLGTAVDVSILAGLTATTFMYLAKHSRSAEKESKLKTVYKPLLQKILKGKIDITSLSLNDIRMCMEATPSSEEEFFRDFKDPADLRSGLQPIVYGESLPTCYSTDFETTFARSEYERSSISDLGFKEPPKGRIGFINGMLNPYQRALRSTLLISYLSGGYNVHMVHNPTHGFSTDLKECRGGLEGVVTDPVWHLHHMWDDFFLNENTGEDEVFLQICHSQGAIHVTNALKHYPEEYRKRIKVVAIAPGGYIPKGLCKEAHHYVSRDPVPHLDSKGQSKAARVYYCPPTSLINHRFKREAYYNPLREHLLPFVKERR